ncbi:MAG: cell surface protein SprA, partial [Chitinophagales bacterium]
ALGYNFSTKGKFITPFEKSIPKNQANLALVRDFNFNLLPTGYSFRTEMNRQFGETLMRDIYGDGLIDPTYNKYFNWDRFYGIKFEPARSLKIDFSASNNSRVDEPYGKIDSPEKRDTIWNNIKSFGRTITYRQNLNVSYNVPIGKIPSLNWITLRASYNATFSWVAGSLGIADTLGNTIGNTQAKTINGELNFRNLYNKSKFLKQYNTATIANKSADRNQKKEEKPQGDEMREGEEKVKKSSTAKVGLGGEILTRLLISVKRITINYSENFGTTLPGYFPKPQLFGLNLQTEAPGLGFVFGQQPTNPYLENASGAGWLSAATSLNALLLQSFSQNLDIRANIEPLPDLRLDMNLNKTYSENNSEYYKNIHTLEDPEFAHLNPLQNGNLLMSYSIMGTIFDKLNTTDVTETFRRFEENRLIITQRY